MRILGMDVGDRRIGIAISDMLGITAQGLDTLERKNHQHDLEHISNIIQQYHPHQIVLGLPKNMNGTLGPQGDKVKEFSEELQAIYNGEIIFWDERLTTVSAHKTMIEGNVRRKKRKQHVDRMAAVLILQGYLDFLSSR